MYSRNILKFGKLILAFLLFTFKEILTPSIIEEKIIEKNFIKMNGGKEEKWN